jgi:hypothetical protein
MSDQDFETLQAMTKFGGGFVKALAQAAHHADSNNLERIKQAWPEYWKQYEEMGKSLERTKNK